jgi:hypothetical protein
MKTGSTLSDEEIEEFHKHLDKADQKSHLEARTDILIATLTSHMKQIDWNEESSRFVDYNTKKKVKVTPIGNPAKYALSLPNDMYNDCTVYLHNQHLDEFEKALDYAIEHGADAYSSGKGMSCKSIQFHKIKRFPFF